MAIDDKFLEEDRQYSRLLKEKKSLEERMLLRKIKVLKDAGIIVDSADKLICDKHKTGNYALMKYFISEGQLKTYSCSICDLPSESKNPAERSTAYECPKCGIVKGEYMAEAVSNPFHDGSGVEKIYCRICNLMLGKNYFSS